jgi:adenylate cyclase class 2
MAEQAVRYEVEQKFPVPDLSGIERKLHALGARFNGPIRQSDGYFAHPNRDFSRTDEALRIRRVGECHFVTYKGPKVDTTTKTRREIEMQLSSADDGAGRFRELLDALGFRPVAEVEKMRRTATLIYHEREVEVALDLVTGLGEFVELEVVADEDDLAAARQAINDLAAELALSEPERRSYLEMIMGD